MKNLGIKSRVIILGTIPALLFAIILAGYAISNVFGVLNQSLLDRGRVIASQLAPAAEYGVISGNSLILQKLVQKVLASGSEVRTVLVLNNKGQVLALSGPEISAELLDKISKQKYQELSLDKGIVFTSTIQRSLVAPTNGGSSVRCTSTADCPMPSTSVRRSRSPASGGRRSMARSR